MKANDEKIEGSKGNIITLSLAMGLPKEAEGGHDCTSLENPRPVSNCLFLGKVIERAIAKQFQCLHHHWTYSSLAFAPTLRETVLVILANYLFRQLDQGRLVLLVSLDLTAAFDTV